MPTYLAYTAGSLVILGLMLMATGKWKAGIVIFWLGLLVGVMDLWVWLA